MRFRTPMAFASLTLCARVSTASGQTFTRIIGTGDPVPGGAFPLLGFDEAPALKGDHIAFIGFYQNLSGGVSAIYSNAGGSFAPVVQTGEPMPTEPVNFEFVFRLAVDGDDVAFIGSSFQGGVARNGIYTNATGGLTELVDENTQIPGGVGRFTQISGQDFSFGSGRVAFSGSGSSSQRGIYAVNADGNMQMPGQPAGTDFLFFGTPTLRDDRIAFPGHGGGQSGIFEQYGVGSGPLNRLVDTSMSAPSGNAYGLIAVSAVDEDVTLFQAYAPGSGLYWERGGQVTTIADISLPLPGGGGNFAEFNNCAVSNGRVVIEGFDFNSGGQQGVFSNLCGGLAPVLVPGDALDGRTVQHVRFDEDSLDGDRLACVVSFTDGTQAVYVAAGADSRAFEALGGQFRMLFRGRTLQEAIRLPGGGQQGLDFGA